jgi:uncharacterized protein with HEPN domain
VTPTRIDDYLSHMELAAQDACTFVMGLSKEDFLLDKKTQQATIMSIVIVGEAATKVMDSDPEFVLVHSEIPWRSMRGMRNRIAHGYFEIDLDVVWETLTTALPALVQQLSAIRQDRRQKLAD